MSEDHRETQLDDESENELAGYATILDEAAAAGSHFKMVSALFDKLGYGAYQALPDDAPDAAVATLWAFEYTTEVTDGAAKRVRIAPRNNFGGSPHPPMVSDVPNKHRQVWRELLDLVSAPQARARLAHLLFDCGGPQRYCNAITAIDSYLEAASQWRRPLDCVEDLHLALRLSRAVGDEARVLTALDRLLDEAESELAKENPLAGPVLQALTYVSSEPLSPPRCDDLLEAAALRLTDVDHRDQALRLILQRCRDDDCRRKTRRRRVDAYIDLANATEPGILQLVHLQDALGLAEESSDPSLRERAAAALQKMRDRDLGLVRIESSSALYVEMYEQLRDSYIAGNSWQEALLRFATAGPLSGSVDDNRALVQQIQAANPLRALMPDKVLGPDKLPILEAITPEEKMEYDLVVNECRKVEILVRPLVEALHTIVTRFGLPSSQQLLQFLVTWPGIALGGVNMKAVVGIVRALHRFWGGDSEGATYTLVPCIEAFVRELILRTNRGIYKLQEAHKPGQYPGLGAMLPILAEQFEISESMLRFLKALLTEAAGFNIRNQLSHGVVVFGDPGTAALLIHTALFLGTLKPKPNSALADDADAAPEDAPEVGEQSPEPSGAVHPGSGEA